MGTHDYYSEDHVFTLVTLPPFPSYGCDHEAEHLCEQECRTSRDIFEAAGSWTALVNGSRLGDLACQSWGKDESHGLVTGMYDKLCERDRKHVGNFEPHLCCAGGVYVPCSHGKWGMARNRLVRNRP